MRRGLLHRRRGRRVRLLLRWRGGLLLGGWRVYWRRLWVVGWLEHPWVCPNLGVLPRSLALVSARAFAQRVPACHSPVITAAATHLIQVQPRHRPGDRWLG